VGSEPALGFRPLARADLANLAAWLDDPVVSRWWPDPHSADDLEAHYGPSIDGTDPTEVFVITVDGVDAGIIQRYRTVDYVDWHTVLRGATPVLAQQSTAGIDYLLGRPEVRNRGIGTMAIAAFTRRALVEMDGIDAVAVAVQQGNRPSWRALERAGYQRVWAGQLASEDPSDEGPSYVLAYMRSEAPAP
jgi:aminoglycoside 6'-N-acetyltransferase